jgi:hypothetical protein
MSWEQNWQTCCSLGMEPLLIESAKDLKCLSNVTKNSIWSGNFNYWTGGTQKDCRGSWTWCGKDGARMLNNDVTWDKDQPDNISTIPKNTFNFVYYRLLWMQKMTTSASLLRKFTLAVERRNQAWYRYYF